MVQNPGATGRVGAANQRLAALVDSGLLDSDPEAAFDRYTRLIRKMLGVPVALVSLVTEDRQFFKSEQGLEGAVKVRRETPISHSFCRFVLAGEPLVVEDTRGHPDHRHNPSVDELHVAAYAGYPVRNSEGHVFGALCAIDDQPRRWRDDELALLADLADAVSAEVQLREQLLRERRREAHLELVVSRLEEVQGQLVVQLRAQEETTALVSHDLRTPLSALLMGVGLLEDQPEEGARHRVAGRMRGAIREMDDLIGDLLDLVRLNAGGLSFDFEDCAVDELLRELEAAHVDAAGAAGVSMHFESDGRRLHTDQGRLLQALSKLVCNAIRAAGPGGNVWIRGHAVDDCVTEFSVVDDGPGLDTDVLEHIFEPFKKGASPGAAGLGLAIARGIAVGLGGTLQVEQGASGGAVFRLGLPLAPPAKGSASCGAQSRSAALPR